MEIPLHRHKEGVIIGNVLINHKAEEIVDMQLKKATGKAQWRQIYRLYREAFPECEQKPFWLIRLKNIQGKADAWYMEDKGTFVGLAITMNAKELVLLDYFAIEESLRGKGYGSEGLKALQTYYAGRKFFLEAESVYAEAENREQRLRRKQFYLKNGMSEMKMIANVFGTDLEVLGHDCRLDFDTYRSVYQYAYGKWAAGNVELVPYPQKEE